LPKGIRCHLLAQEIRDSGESLWKVARGAGVDLSTLKRYMSESDEDHRDIRLERTADKLFKYLGLKVAKGGGKAKGQPTKKKL